MFAGMVGELQKVAGIFSSSVLGISIKSFGMNTCSANLIPPDQMYYQRAMSIKVQLLQHLFRKKVLV